MEYSVDTEGVPRINNPSTNDAKIRMELSRKHLNESNFTFLKSQLILDALEALIEENKLRTVTDSDAIADRWVKNRFL